MPCDDLAKIEPLIVQEEQQGKKLSVTFRCPETGVEACGVATVEPLTSVQAAAERSARKHGWAGLRRAVTKTIASSLGSGTAGKIARDVAGSALGSKGRGQEFTREEIRAAVVQAFAAVESRFRWDAASGEWRGEVSEEAPV